MTEVFVVHVFHVLRVHDGFNLRVHDGTACGIP